MLLSRLKNRNKTMPSMDNHTEGDSGTKQETHLVSRNTWTAPELETVLPPPNVSEITDTVHSSPPTLDQQSKEVMTNLPQLPNIKGIKLPPIKRKWV